MHDRDPRHVEVAPGVQGSAEPTIEIGTKVYVRNRFLGGYSSGFEVAEVLANGYLLRRLSDGYKFPDVFELEDVKRDRRKDPFRGITGSYLDRRHS